MVVQSHAIFFRYSKVTLQQIFFFFFLFYLTLDNFFALYIKHVLYDLGAVYFGSAQRLPFHFSLLIIINIFYYFVIFNFFRNLIFLLELSLL